MSPGALQEGTRPEQRLRVAEVQTIMQFMSGLLEAPRRAIHHARHCREGALTRLIKISPAAIEARFL